VQGSSLDVHPILREEVYRIALEALRNSSKHAEAKSIEAEIVYATCFPPPSGRTNDHRSLCPFWSLNKAGVTC